MKKIFIDANIVLDLLDGTRISHSNSKTLFKKLIDLNYTIVISEDILTTIYYVIKNKQAVLNFFETIAASWEIAGFGKKVINNAVKLCLVNNNLDFEDVIQSLCAKDCGCSKIISNDKNFYNCGVPVVDAEEFIK